MTRVPGLVLALSWSATLAAAVVLVPFHPWLGAAAIALAIPTLALAFLLRPALIAMAVGCALLGLARAELPAGDPFAQSRAIALAGQVITMTGRVADDSRPTGGGSEVLVAPDHVVGGAGTVTDIGDLMIRWRGPEVVGFGDEVQATGKLTLPRDLPSFDRRAYLAQRHVYVELQATSLDLLSTDRGPLAVPAWLRAHYTSALDSAMPAPHAAVLLGIVLGIHRGIPASLQNALIASGLIHLLVLSGLKVAVFARLVQASLSPILGRHATWPALALIAVYAMVGGATPAATRAAAMGGLAIAASHLGRPTHVWTSLAVTAAAMLGWRPELAWDVGFQLSFAGTAAIILLTPTIARLVGFLPHVLREPFAVTCAAQIGTLPMMAADFHVLSPVAPIANALTLPILPAVIACGLVLGLLGFMPELATLAAIPIAGLIAYIEQVAFLLARVPAAAIAVPKFPIWVGLAYYSALGPAIAGVKAKGHRRAVAIAAAVLLPAAISVTSLIAWAYAPPEVVVMNVGDGQAILLRGPQGAILVDSGPSPARLRDELGTALPPWQHMLNAIVITAPSLGHVGGFAYFDRPALTVLLPEADLAGSAWRTAALHEAARGASLQRIGAGQAIEIAGWQLQALAPEPGAPGDQVGAADLAFRAVAPDGRSFCDLSDLDLDAQTVAASRLRGTCTLLLLPSGGRSLLSPDLERAALAPTTQLIASRSSGRIAAGYPGGVLRTDQEGTITLPL